MNIKEMLLGREKTEADPGGGTESRVVFDVSTPEFEERVFKASMDKAILVQFWAPWCGPCKQLGPVLEAAVQSFNGEVLLARINIDENQELGAALRVQSVPTVYALFRGRPVDAFQGVIPESQIREFINKAVQTVRQSQPDAIDIPETLKAAAEALAEKDAQAAHGLYSQVLSQDHQNVTAFVGLVRVFIMIGQIEKAEQLVEDAPEDIAAKPDFEQAKTALELAKMKPKDSAEDIASKMVHDPGNHQLRFDLAIAQFSEGQKEKAIDSLLEIIKADLDWNEQAARKQLLKFFEAMGHTDPLTMAGRRKLSAILFS